MKKELFRVVAFNDQTYYVIAGGIGEATAIVLNEQKETARVVEYLRTIEDDAIFILK